MAGGVGAARCRGAGRECDRRCPAPGEGGSQPAVDRAAHAGWPARPAGHLDQRHADAARAAARHGRPGVPHRAGGGRARGPGGRAPGRGRRARGETGGAGQGRHRQLQPVLERLGLDDPAHQADRARRRSAGWPGPGPSRGRGPARRGAEAQHRASGVHEHVGPVHLARRPGVDHPGRLQQRLPDRADAGPRGDSRRDDPRRADHPGERAGAAAPDAAPDRGRLARPLGRRHPGGRDHQLQRPQLDCHQRRVGPHQGHPAEHGADDRRAVHEDRRRPDRLRSANRGSGGVHPAVDAGLSVDARRRPPHRRGRVPRRQPGVDVVLSGARYQERKR
jgi:hypothetical protein